VSSLFNADTSSSASSLIGSSFASGAFACQHQLSTLNNLVLDTGLFINKQIHLVVEHFILKVHQNATNYSYTVDVSVSDRDRNVNSVRIIGCVFMKFLICNKLHLFNLSFLLRPPPAKLCPCSSSEKALGLVSEILFFVLKSIPNVHPPHTHTPFQRAFFPGEPGLAGCPLNSPSPFIPGLCILLGQT